MTSRIQRASESLATRLGRELEGEVLFDSFSRGLYSTDASIYQITPVGVAVPRGVEDIRLAIQVAASEGVPVLPRGAGTSLSGGPAGTNFAEWQKGQPRLHPWRTITEAIRPSQSTIVLGMNSAIGGRRVPVPSTR